MRAAITGLCLLCLAALTGCDTDGWTDDPPLFVVDDEVRYMAGVDLAGVGHYSASMYLEFTNDGEDPIRDVQVVEASLRRVKGGEVVAELVSCPTYHWDHEIEPFTTDREEWYAWLDESVLEQDDLECDVEVYLELTIIYEARWLQTLETAPALMECHELG